MTMENLNKCMTTEECKKKLREYLREHPDCLHESKEEWISKMTPEQKKEYYKSLDTFAMMEIMYPIRPSILKPIDLEEIEKLRN